MRRTGGRILATRRGILGALAGLAALPGTSHARRDAALVVGMVSPAGAEPGTRLTRLGAEIGAEMLARRGRPVLLRFAEAATAEAAQRAALRLVEDGAGLLVSSCGDSGSTAILAAAERRGVPLIVARATCPRLADRGARLLVRTTPSLSQLLGRGLGLLHDLSLQAGVPPPRSFALVHADDEAGTTMRQALGTLLPSLMPAHAFAAIPLSRPWEAAAEAVMGGLRTVQPDVIVLEAPPGLAAPCLAAIVGNGVRPAGVVSFGLAGLATEEVLALPSGGGEGHVTFAPWPDPRSPVTAEARSLFLRRNVTLPFETAQGALALGVDALLLAGEAAVRTPGARGAALAAALRATTLGQKMMRGPAMRFDARGQNLAMPSAALQNRDGRPRVVLPADWAETRPSWPNALLSKS